MSYKETQAYLTYLMAQMIMIFTIRPPNVWLESNKSACKYFPSDPLAQNLSGAIVLIDQVQPPLKTLLRPLRKVLP